MILRWLVSVGWWLFSHLCHGSVKRSGRRPGKSADKLKRLHRRRRREITRWIRSKFWATRWALPPDWKFWKESFSDGTCSRLETCPL